MIPIMSPHITRHIKLPSAAWIRALKRLRSRVSIQVNLQTAWSVESFSTMGASVTFAIGTLSFSVHTVLSAFILG